MATCDHFAVWLEGKHTLHTSAKGCEECLAMGDTWVHLRICLECGHVGCCNDSKNKHATKHFHSSNHTLIQSFEPNENWVWCYVDQKFIGYSRKLYAVG
jgi:uncharacterized UBP type Zn finger protein